MVTSKVYLTAFDLLEKKMNRDISNKGISAESMQGFNHILCGMMRDAFIDGLNGNQAPSIISELRATEKPFMKATAAVIEYSYNTGIEQGGKK